MKKLFVALICMTFFVKFAVAAHFITGYVEDALDGTSPNGKSVTLTNSLGENMSSIVGPSGPSGASNIYLMDCELFSTPCFINEVLNVSVNDSGGYSSLDRVQVAVTGAGFDVAPNLSLNTPPNVSTVLLEDSFSSPVNELDLTVANATTITCSATVFDWQGGNSITNVSAVLYSINSSSFGGAEDNNTHYTNASCGIDASFGNTYEAQTNCTFAVEYYALAEYWRCTVVAQDNYTAIGNESDDSIINPLIGIGTENVLQFGTINGEFPSNESILNITNLGNVELDISLSGYGKTQYDNLSLVCEVGANVSIENMKYNLTDSNPGVLDLASVEGMYVNLTAFPVLGDFNLSYRVNESENNALNATYWRAYITEGAGGNCQGNIIVAASQS